MTRQESPLAIRRERPEDYGTILRLTYEAFLTLDYPGRRRLDEHYLIRLLRGAASVIPELCFVAERAGEIVGHILYTKSKIVRPDGSEIETLTFGPLSVWPKLQRQGIGAALVRHSLSEARALGYGAVLITGVPEYYPKLGFQRAREYGLSLADGFAGDAFMAYELRPGTLAPGGTLHFLTPEFEQAEQDDAGYAVFHEQFMREYRPGELTLRPLFEADVALVGRWLHTPHVAKWYQYPEHWLHELRERHGEFSFLTHFIAEYEGVPIGFCQYYDCWFSQQHEVWNDAWRVGERQGEVFSIDYLIGETAYLRRGFGRRMVALLLERLRERGAKTVVVQPESENTASNRSLAANGFQWNGEEYYLGF